MTTYNSPELVESRLESAISRSESRSHSQIAEVERRLTDRIHDIERRSRWDFETSIICLYVACFAFILGLAFAHHPSRCDADDIQPAAQANQPKAQISDRPSPHQDAAQ